MARNDNYGYRDDDDAYRQARSARRSDGYDRARYERAEYGRDPYGQDRVGRGTGRARDDGRGGYGDAYVRESGAGYATDGRRSRGGGYGQAAGDGSRGETYRQANYGQVDGQADYYDRYDSRSTHARYNAHVASRSQGAHEGRRSHTARIEGTEADARYPEGRSRSYSRYDSAERYASAARERSNPRDGSRAAGRGSQEARGGRGRRGRTDMPTKGGYALPKGGSRSRGGSVKDPLARRDTGLTLGGGRRRSGLSTNAITAIVGIVVAAVIAIVGIVMWTNRSVPITLNGQEVSVRVGSTIDQVIEAQALELTPGNLISVSGNKIEDGTGYAYLAKLNDNELDGEATAAYRVAEGDSLTLENGRDRTEDYTVEIVEEQPKLEMGGDSWGNISYISQWPKTGQYEMRTGQRSGEVARGDTIQETQNCVVSVHQITPDNGQKLVCLTFDDGPAETYTEAYIEILNKYGIHATFFNLGQNVEAYPELAKKIVESGNELMSHTYQHQQLSLLDAAALQEEFSSTFSTLESVAGVKTTSFRPPYGDFKESTWLASGGLASVSVLWNQDSLDWKRGGADSIVSNSLANITSGSIILMHDGGGERSQDVEALPQIIEQLQSEGYTFVTVTELMKSDSSIPAEIANGDATMPDDCTWPAELAETTSTDTTDTTSTTTSES